MKAILYILLAYFCGSILFANVFATIFGKRDYLENSRDKNPGAANAFQYGGFWCGLLTLLCDILKGFAPVRLYLQQTPFPEGWVLALVLAAPVVGHIFPIQRKFHGGKGIATTFGCLLGLFPYGLPFLTFAAAFIFLSVCLRISPHFYRTIAAYVCTAAALLLMHAQSAVCAGFLLITAVVCLRMRLSKEEKEKLEVKLLWMR